MIIERLITYEEGDRYIEVPFLVTPNMERIHVSMEVTANGPGDCVIDLGVRDIESVRGWSGGARTEFYMESEQATPGYIPGELMEGEWSVLLGTYRIPPAGCRVRVEVTCTPKQGRWLKGDLHMHTVHSDGALTIAENAKTMAELGCDFLAMTDHNTYSQNLAYPRESGVVLIPGMELTTNHGHANLLGVVRPIQDFRAVSSEQVQERLQEARRNGARIVLNHPHCPNCGWEWEWSVDYDWVEIWNGPWREANQQTLTWWHEQLCSGRRLVAVGGSDMHRPDTYSKHSMPTTWVYAASRTIEGILEGIDTGRVFLSFSPEGPTLELNAGQFQMGDVVPAQAPERAGNVTLVVKELQVGDTVKLISNRGVEVSCVVYHEESLELMGDMAGRTFYRAEVWRYFTEVQANLLAAVSNPLYLD
ncbi:phosphoesterase [Paenibacillus pectinilyticus]|uniref:Phosphoesterase n=1 Tax=Paenibacillus pectinilyticus TaxID=512399 RepID=A0A1C1A5Q9_9BACL|nr:CehA/McbA family metallohydrolase [Paenibacillus pectinilyticus]OCT15869.1 phosphoesterase [Paenibacillus pectinilyticus]